MGEIHRVYQQEHVVPGKRLGRHVEHDPRSRQHAFGATITPAHMVTFTHRRYGKLFLQAIGSCTGEAAAGSINCRPLHKLGSTTLHQADAVDIYSRATVVDGFPGEYPPDDTGSSGLAAAQVLKERGLIDSYKWAFSVEEALTALQVGPILVGSWWYEGFDNPDPFTGLVRKSGQIRGGHEFVCRGFEWHRTLEDSLILADNSWGYDWGRNGKFCMKVSTYREIIADDGDCVIPWRNL